MKNLLLGLARSPHFEALQLFAICSRAQKQIYVIGRGGS